MTATNGAILIDNSANRRTEIAALMANLFRGCKTHVALAGEDGKGFAPFPLKGELPPAWISERHLAGLRCLGFYVLTAASCCWCSAVDFDNKPSCPDPEYRDKAEKVYFWLSKCGLSPVVEISQSGEATHVWLFFEELMPAVLIRQWWEFVSHSLEIPFREIYPRQDFLSGKGLGNLIRYPLWGQSRFVDVENDWQTIDPLECLRGIKKTSIAEIRTLAFGMGCSLVRPAAEADHKPSVNGHVQLESQEAVLSPRVKSRLDRSGSLLARRWSGDKNGMKDQSNSALVLSIACEFVRQYVPTAEIFSALRVWCRENEYDKGEGERALTRCVSAAYEHVLQKQEARSSATTELKDACHAFVGVIEQGLPQFVTSGITELDQSIDGIAYGQMCVLAARPSHGKSALALQWLDEASGRGIPGLIISEEMGAIELGGRVLLNATNLSAEYWDSNTVDKLRKDVDKYFSKKAPVYIVENCASIDRAEDVITQHARQKSVKLVAVDYLQLLRSRASSKYEEVSDVSRRLKQSAGLNQVAMIAVCQLNRDIDKRQSREPVLSDLRDSGGIEQDADMVIFAQWPWKYDSTCNPSQFFLYVAKRRNGPIRKAKIETHFAAERQRVGVLPSGLLPEDADAIRAVGMNEIPD